MEENQAQLGQVLATIQQQLQQQQQQLQQLQAQQQQLTEVIQQQGVPQQMPQQMPQQVPQPMPQRMPQQMPQDGQIEDEMDDDSEFPMGWQQLLGSKKTVATNATSVALVQLLENPPPLDSLEDKKSETSLYQGVPETPPPRRNRVDFSLWQGQQKIEFALHNILHHLETGENTKIGIAAAWARSAWQDLHEQRRQLLAGGKGKTILERRPDEQKPRLITPQEEEKINRAKRPQAKVTHVWGTNGGPHPPATRPTYSTEFSGQIRSRSRNRGTGKATGDKMQN
jgi:hypothetical protein